MGKRIPPAPPFPEERPTGVICLSCAGEKQLLEETATNYKAIACKWCGGTGVMSREQEKAWKQRERP